MNQLISASEFAKPILQKFEKELVLEVAARLETEDPAVIGEEIRRMTEEEGVALSDKLQVALLGGQA